MPNRAAFLERLSLEFARARRGGHQFAVHYLDLDHFKDVNDTLGHPVCDELLRLVAARLKACVRETDLVARFGGDEFAVLALDSAEMAAMSKPLAIKIRTCSRRRFTIDCNQIHTTVSIGIVPYRSDIAGSDDIDDEGRSRALPREERGPQQVSACTPPNSTSQIRKRIMIGEEFARMRSRIVELELFLSAAGRDQNRTRSSDWKRLLRWIIRRAVSMLPARLHSHRGNERDLIVPIEALGDSTGLPADQGLERLSGSRRRSSQSMSPLRSSS